MNTKQLRQKILDLAIHGKLVPQDPTEGSAEDLLREIGKARGKKIETIVDNVPFEVPDGWCWCRLKDIFSMQAGKTIKADELSSERNSINKYECFGGNGIRGYIAKKNNEGKHCIIGRQGALCGNVNIANGEFYATEHAIVVTQFDDIDVDWAYYFLTASNLNQYATATAQPGLAVRNIIETLIPLPPLSEQKRIVERVELLLNEVEAIEKAEGDIKQIANILRSKVLDLAIRGKLTGSDTTGWKWVKMEDVAMIARGGSPRPIKEFLTDSPQGINWIKIGDTEKGGKYINSCKEKIIKEGVKKSRMVYPGDFLLTNSMSFGRPYISTIEGCIHDGWLVISPMQNTFDKDYLYYLLSSTMVYKQFCDQASGSTVSNLNIDKVAATTIPLPPLSEQKRIVEKIEQLFAEIDILTR